MNKSWYKPFEIGNHIALVTFDDNYSWVEYCTKILEKGKKSNHYCFLDTLSKNIKESNRVTSEIFKHIKKESIDEFYSGEFGSKNDFLSDKSNHFEPQRIRVIEERNDRRKKQESQRLR